MSNEIRTFRSRKTTLNSHPRKECQMRSGKAGPIQVPGTEYPRLTEPLISIGERIVPIYFSFKGSSSIEFVKVSSRETVVL